MARPRGRDCGEAREGSQERSGEPRCYWRTLLVQPRSQGTLNAAKEDIVLQYTYPRLDAEVSKHRNHLLKAPFCVHPKTGRVCVPVDPRTIDKFNPSRVPTVGQLLRELDQLAPTQPVENGSGEHHSDWERTSLKPYVEMLDKHALAIMEETRKVKQKMGACFVFPFLLFAVSFAGLLMLSEQICRGDRFRVL